MCELLKHLIKRYRAMLHNMSLHCVLQASHIDGFAVPELKPNKAQHNIAIELLASALLQHIVAPCFLESTAFKAYVRLISKGAYSSPSRHTFLQQVVRVFCGCPVSLTVRTCCCLTNWKLDVLLSCLLIPGRLRQYSETPTTSASCFYRAFLSHQLSLNLQGYTPRQRLGLRSTECHLSFPRMHVVPNHELLKLGVLLQILRIPEGTTSNFLQDQVFRHQGPAAFSAVVPQQSRE
jgi:hypothetical protein